jgi:hypothetical protein
MMNDKLVLDCDCAAAHHQVVAKLTDWGSGDVDLTLYVQLHQWRPWWKRVYCATKWVFGGMVPWGHWDSTTLRTEDAAKWRDMLVAYLDAAPPKDGR